MVNDALLTQARQLSVAERVELADAILATVDAGSMPVTSEIATLVDQRIADVKADPLAGRGSETVVAELRAHLP